MFSPTAFPNGAILYDFITHVPPPSHVALSPFDLYREPLAVIALADGREMGDAVFSKRHSMNGPGPTMVEKNIRALYQELEELRDNFPKVLVHRILIFDCVPGDVPIPEGMTALPPADEYAGTALKAEVCDISSILLAEMMTLAKSFEAMTAIESPGLARQKDGPDGTSEFSRRTSPFPMAKHLQRSNSMAAFEDRNLNRSSMPTIPNRPRMNSSNSTPARPSTPVHGSGSSHPLGHDGPASVPGTVTSSPTHKATKPDAAEEHHERSLRDRVFVQGFGPGGANERLRLKKKGRLAVVIGSMYLQAGRWGDSLKELSDGAAAARSLNDHIWHAKALELILVNLLLLGWSGLEFQVPTVCLQNNDKTSLMTFTGLGSEVADPRQPKHIGHLQSLLTELLEKIISSYSRLSAENLPPLPLSERIIGFSKIQAALHICDGKLSRQCFDMIVMGKRADRDLTTTPRLLVNPTRQSILAFLFRAFPSVQTELLTTVDRVSILSGIASVLGPLGYHRKKAMVIRELVSVLIGGLVEARTRGAAEAGVHPAAGLISLIPGDPRSNGAMALDLSEGDVEQGIEAFLELLCKSYGIVGFDHARPRRQSLIHGFDDSDEAVIARIRSQLATRFFGFTSIKLNILRACINFSEALPDFNGVLKFSSDLMRTAGSGVAPGPRHEDAAPLIHRDEQIRLATNISRTSGLVQRIGMTHLTAEFWDEFLVREVRLEPLPSTRIPVPHARHFLPGATAARTSQDVNPFIYNPFLKEADDTAAAHLVADELARFKVTLQNTYDIELDIESIRLETEGVEFEALKESAVVGPYRTQVLRLQGRPKEEGFITITGAIIKIRGCRERRFAIFPKPFSPHREEKIKVRGVASMLGAGRTENFAQFSLEPYSLDLNVTRPQPLLTVKSTTLPQSSVMILEGERQTFSVTLQNQSPTPVDFMLFSFKDSTQEPLQAALSSRDATPVELYEYELILMKKQALRLPQNDQGRSIAAHGEATFEFEILGKPGLTQATIQVDYTHLGVPRDEVTEQFYTRQLSVEMTVTVNASVELIRIDTMPMRGLMPQPLRDRLGGPDAAVPDEHCLLSLDLRNAWPSQVTVQLESRDGISVEEDILPGKTSRVIIPIKRIYLEDPHASIPSLNPRSRQFVLSTSKVSPDMERAHREAFWYREKILESLRTTWRTTSVPKKSGAIELRNMRLTTRMIDIIKIPEVEIDVFMESPPNNNDNNDDDDDNNNNNNNNDGSQEPRRTAYVDEFMQIRVHITNRTKKAILPLVRLVPSLCHRTINIALDHTRKFAWNGTLQQLLPELAGNSAMDFTIGVTALCRGKFEITASVEEVRLRGAENDEQGGDGKRWTDRGAEEEEEEDSKVNDDGGGRGGETGGEKEMEEEENEKAKQEEEEEDLGHPRPEDIQKMMDAALGVKERRMWHSRQPCILTVKDRE
ncbi:Transport protein particle subunit [Escovopsis weberi]|uniref:Transport protein particle subunit n=1 Tax=Escovopsis weberi TaxID=150374 RepID=A0A0M8MYH7_ESCWE|nr:Transport protein particle subunit [Escovopsis weberi]